LVGKPLLATATGPQWRWSCPGAQEGKPPSVKASDGGDGIAIALPDHCSLYHTTSPGYTAISSDPALLAAAAGAGLDDVALYSDLAVGFRLGGRTLFRGVRRVAGPACVEVTSSDVNVKEDGGTRVADPESALRSLAQRVARDFDGGYVLELTGGLDSRLLLALGISAGARPRMAMTLGSRQDPDVEVAGRLCAQLGIEHVVLEERPDKTALAADAVLFGARSGHTSNAASYAWLVSVFRALAPRRAKQMTGSAGECATGFYYTPADWVFEMSQSTSLWTSLRLRRPGDRAGTFFGPGQRRQLRAALVADVRESLDGEGRNWRGRTDRFYKRQRLEYWGKPVLEASRHWYEVSAPFMSQDYEAWSASLTQADRHSRQGQRALIRRLAPMFDSIPFATEIAPSGGSPSRFSKALRKYGSRLMGLPHAPDLGAAQTASALLANRALADELRECVVSTGLRAEGVADAFNTPGASPHECGALFTAAVAIKAKALYETEIARR
jgi:asparagine synthase (glutamine-hydrolysing)